MEKLAWVASDILGFVINTVDEETLEGEIQVVKNEKRQRVDNQPYGHSSGIIQKALYPSGHPYSWSVIGELEDLQAATINDVKESMKNSGRHVSMDAPLVEGEDSNLYDVLRSGESPNPDKELIHESLRTEIVRALETLTPREADVIKLYFGLGENHPMTLEEIGETFDLTRERVRQIKEKAIRRLKHTSRSKILKTYLG